MYLANEMPFLDTLSIDSYRMMINTELNSE